MSRLPITLLAALAVLVFCTGARRRWVPAALPGPTTYLINDDLTHLNSSAATTAGWILGGAGVWGYTTAPAPLVGLPRSYKAYWGDSAYFTIPASSQISSYIVMNAPTVTVNGGRSIYYTDSSGTILAKVLMSTGDLTIGWGTTSGGAQSYTIATNQTLHVWLRYVKGTTGSNAVIQLYVSTDGLKGSPVASITAAAGITDVTRVYIGSEKNATIIYNKLRTAVTPLGDNGS